MYATQRNGYPGNRSNLSGGYDASLRLVAFRSMLRLRARKPFGMGGAGSGGRGEHPTTSCAPGGRIARPP